MIPKTSVYRTVISDIGLKFQFPIEVPHILDSQLKGERVQKSIELLKVLESPGIKSHMIITGDEAWL